MLIWYGLEWIVIISTFKITSEPGDGGGTGRGERNLNNKNKQNWVRTNSVFVVVFVFVNNKNKQKWVRTTSAFVNLNDDNQQNSVKTNLANHFQIRNKTQNYPKMGKNAKIFDLHPGGLVTTLTQRFEALERGSGWSLG